MHRCIDQGKRKFIRSDERSGYSCEHRSSLSNPGSSLDNHAWTCNDGLPQIVGRVPCNIDHLHLSLTLRGSHSSITDHYLTLESSDTPSFFSRRFSAIALSLGHVQLLRLSNVRIENACRVLPKSAQRRQRTPWGIAARAQHHRRLWSCTFVTSAALGAATALFTKRSRQLRTALQSRRLNNS
jgi:hypothetical protein